MTEFKEMKSPVWLTIRGDTMLAEAEMSGDEMELLTEGELYWEDHVPCLSYMESEISGMGNTHTTVRLDVDKVSVIRLGDINSVMEFEKGSRKMSLYSTPFGELSMGITTRDIDVAYDETRTPTHIKVDYDIDIMGMGGMSNNIDIAVRVR